MSEDVMSRIGALLTECHKQEGGYCRHRRLPERSVTAWERRHGVILPDEYRAFIREVGNGGMMPGHYCDFIIHPLAEVLGSERAATPFPVKSKRFRERMRQLAVEGWPTEGVLFPELEPYWDRIDQPPGCIVFGQYPSSDALLLVTAGDLRGSVWCSVCLGVPELTSSRKPLGFLAWFASTLNELLHGEFGPVRQAQAEPDTATNSEGRDISPKLERSNRPR